jgi:putative transposase
VHLKTADLTKPMGSFSISFAKAMNKRYERVGPLFQGRFASRLVDNDGYLLHLSRYIHLNPVNAGVCRES